jgi:hypothetical protein
MAPRWATTTTPPGGMRGPASRPGASRQVQVQGPDLTGLSVALLLHQRGARSPGRGISQAHAGCYVDQLAGPGREPELSRKKMPEAHGERHVPSGEPAGAGRANRLGMPLGAVAASGRVWVPGFRSRGAARGPG